MDYKDIEGSWFTGVQLPYNYFWRYNEANTQLPAQYTRKPDKRMNMVKRPDLNSKLSNISATNTY